MPPTPISKHEDESRAARTGPSATLRAGVDGLLERHSAKQLIDHGLGPLAANRLRRSDAVLPGELLLVERATSLAAAMASPLLRQVREICEGRLVVLKGPELAQYYPASARHFSDLDVLSLDAPRAHRSLVAAGFTVDAGKPDARQHLPVLSPPTLPLQIEVHRHVKWPLMAGPPPPVDEIVEASVPSALGIDGILAPNRVHHSLILAAHAWEHRPLRCLRDLLDIAVMSEGVDARELSRTAARWNIGPIWRTSRNAVDSIFYGRSPSMPLRVWARHLEEARERTIVEDHLERLLSGFWGMPAHRTPAHVLRVISAGVTPGYGESWSGKLRRSYSAARGALQPLSTKDDPRLPPAGSRSYDR